MRRARLARNVPMTIDKKRVWDDKEGDGLNVSVDVDQLRKRRLEAAEAGDAMDEDVPEEGADDDVDSMLDSDEDMDDEEEDTEHSRQRAASNAPSEIGRAHV